MKREQTIEAALLLGLVFLFRFPDVFRHFHDWDEAAMMAQAWAMTRGQVLYKDIFQIHPPLNFWIFVPFFRVLPARVAPHAIKLFNAFLIFGGALLVRRFAHACFKKRGTAFAAAALFVFFLGNGWALSSHGEFYAIFPLLLSADLLFSGEAPARRRCFAAGLLWGAAFFIKQTAAFDAAALFAGFLLFAPGSRRDKLRGVVRLSAGAAAVALAFALYFAAQGTWTEAVRSILIRPFFGYAAASPTSAAGSSLMLRIADREQLFWNFILKPLLLSFAVPLTFALLCVSACLNKGSQSLRGTFREPIFRALLLWFAADLLGIFCIGRGFAHYLLALVPSAALLTARLLDAGSGRFKKPLPYAAYAAVLLLGTVRAWPQWRELAASGGRPPQVRASLAMADYIRDNTREGDRLFFYGVENLDAFYLSGRLANNGVYMYIDMDATHIDDPELESRKRAEFAENPPAVMVVSESSVFHRYATPSAEAFFMGELRDRYELRNEIAGAGIYFLRRRS